MQDKYSKKRENRWSDLKEITAWYNVDNTALQNGKVLLALLCLNTICPARQTDDGEGVNYSRDILFSALCLLACVRVCMRACVHM